MHHIAFNYILCALKRQIDVFGAKNDALRQALLKIKGYTV